jgi:hypothetical protein
MFGKSKHGIDTASGIEISSKHGTSDLAVPVSVDDGKHTAGVLEASIRPFWILFSARGNLGNCSAVCPTKKLE